MQGNSLGQPVKKGPCWFVSECAPIKMVVGSKQLVFHLQAMSKHQQIDYLTLKIDARPRSFF